MAKAVATPASALRVAESSAKDIEGPGLRGLRLLSRNSADSIGISQSRIREMVDQPRPAQRTPEVAASRTCRNRAAPLWPRRLVNICVTTERFNLNRAIRVRLFLTLGQTHCASASPGCQSWPARKPLSRKQAPGAPPLHAPPRTCEARVTSCSSNQRASIRN